MHLNLRKNLINPAPIDSYSEYICDINLKPRPSKYRCWVNFFLFPITLLALLLFITFSFMPETLPKPVLAYLEKSDKPVEPKNSYCRKNPNKKINPEFSRAINLSKERLSNFGTDVSFLDDLVSCVDIQYSNLNFKVSNDKIEGKFEAPLKEPEKDLVKISIDQSYAQNEDLLLAFVLIHELTHAKQYFDFQNTWELKSCLDREAESFNMEINLFLALNPQEQKSLLTRIKNNQSGDTTLKSLERLIQISAKSIETCPNMADEEMIKCFERNNLATIKSALLLNKNYVVQCSA